MSFEFMAKYNATMPNFLERARMGEKLVMGREDEKMKNYKIIYYVVGSSTDYEEI